LFLFSALNLSKIEFDWIRPLSASIEPLAEGDDFYVFAQPAFYADNEVSPLTVTETS
jgi:hypothetical protein